MFLKRVIVTYLCFFFGVGPVRVLAAGSKESTERGSLNYSEHNPLQEISPAAPLRSTPTMLGDSSEYASGFSGDGGSFQSPQTPSSRMSIASSPGLLTKDETAASSRGSEYISGYYRGAVLMPVRLWGAVRQTGLHQIPSGTDLMQLITLAGGPNADAELDELTVKRSTKDGYKIIKVDLGELIESSEKPLELEPNDIVVLPAARPVISTNTLAVVSIIASVVGIVTSSLIIANQFK